MRIFRLDGTGADLELGPGGNPAWSPTGDRIAYVTDGDVVVVDRDGSGTHVVPDLSGRGDSVIWSPDGRRLLYLGGDGSGAFALMSVSVSGDSPPVGLTPLSMDLYSSSIADLSWQPVFP